MTNIADLNSGADANPRTMSWVAIVLSFVAVLLDGLDTSSIGVAAPAIATDFKVSPASLTAAFATTSLGAVLGYLASGSLVSRWQARRVLIASVAAFGGLSLVTPLVSSVEQLAALRLVTAIGLGTALPPAVAIATTQCPRRLREAVAVIVATGMAAGGILGGILGAVLTARFGWKSLFYVGGALPLVFSITLLLWLPRPITERDQTPASERKGFRRSLQLIRDLLAPGFAVRTVSLWIFSFLLFADGYTLVFWLPSLLRKLGFSPEFSQLGVSLFSAGGFIANIVVVLLVSRFPITRVLLLANMLAVVSAAGLAMHDLVPLGISLLIVGTGAGLISCSVGQSALAVSIYPESLRAQGVGFSAAAGRIGSIVGPAVAGLLVSMDLDPKSILLTITIPAFLSIFALLPHLQRDEMRRPVRRPL
ncbi:MFS transporter [Bradyrhizobium sp. Pear77]|uniref:MFS transporter n=1 Tax=Bradyrhizobium altum TaxID=1571202 RepID=UPI0028964EB6|nr:MFS transporter [Bradyrhizobium altum]MCC8953508.1 MFS transporter [Bradyrhizobium altum]